MKKLKSMLRLLFLLCLLCATGCKKKEEPIIIIESGTIGSLTWTLSESGKLIISGKGEMPDFHYYSSDQP